MNKEFSYGIVIVYRSNESYEFLLLQHKNKRGTWSFPKGHMEEGETEIETAKRETFEETNISDIDILDKPIIFEEYEIERKGLKYLKTNGYFVGFVKNKNIKIEESEIKDYKWADFEEAINTFNFYETRKDVLKKAIEYLNSL
jgi:8-oxo-dGTP pyrophosphatase MutT (NUDIX family)